MNNKNKRRALIGGAGGFLGKRLAEELRLHGWEISELTRKRGENGVPWNPSEKFIDAAAAENFDAFVSLNGESLDGRWSEQKKERIAASRIDSATLLASTISKLEKKPEVFVCASAIGYYGKSQKNPCGENSPRGDGFLASVCEAWEDAACKAEKSGTRVVNTRFAPILDRSGGALKKMLDASRFKLSPYFGNPREKFAWVSLDDAARAVVFCIENRNLRGAVNVCAPVSVEKRKLAEEVAKEHGAFVFGMPRIIAKIALGEAADYLLYPDTNALPLKLLEAEFQFRDSSIESVFAKNAAM